MPNGKSGTGGTGGQGQESGLLSKVGKLGDVISLALKAFLDLKELFGRRRGVGPDYFFLSDWIRDQLQRERTARENVMAMLELLMETPGYRQHLSFLRDPMQFYQRFMRRMRPVPGLDITMGELEDALSVLRQLMPPKES